MDWQEQPTDPSDTAVDDAIRHALRQRAGAAEPPDHVWRRLSKQVTAGPSPQRRRRRLEPRTLSAVFAPLVQGLVATSLLLLLGLSLRSSLWEQVYRFGAGAGQPVGSAQPALKAAPGADRSGAAALVEDVADDVESLRTLMRAAQVAAAHDGAATARQRQRGSEQTLPALNKLDDLVDARDVSLEAGVRAGPGAAQPQLGGPGKYRQPVQQQPS